MRRVHQLAEIVALVEAGDSTRAVDLASLHVAEFPDDAAILDLLHDG